VIVFYAQNIETKEKQWMQPENGFLAGTIRNVSEDALRIDDLNGKQWEIKITGETLVRPKVDISVNQMIKVIGIKQTDKTFTAVEIRPWSGCGMMNVDISKGACGNHGGMMRW